jgi:hypothetical protein
VAGERKAEHIDPKVQAGTRLAKAGKDLDAKFTGWPCWGGNTAHTGLPRAEK